MAAIAEIFRRLRLLVRRSRAETELDEEMRLHVELREARLRGEGVAADEARYVARQQFGNHLRLREEGMDAWGWRWLEQLGQDLRFGARELWTNRGFATTAILTLALATGATTAIFSVVNGVLLRPLSFDHPNRLVEVYGRNWSEDRGAPDAITGPVAPAHILAFSRSRSFEGLSGYSVTTSLLQSPSGLERLNAAVVDVGLLSLLGAEAIAGRTFRADDPLDAVVISAALWERRFARDPSVPGKVVNLDGRPLTIVGVMPDSFQFPYRAGSLIQGTQPESRTDVWLPIAPLGAGSLPRGRLSVVGRLKPDVTLETATAELSVIAAQIEEQHNVQFPTPNRFRVGVRLRPLADVVVGPVRRSLWMLFAAVGLVLGAACANVANLLLARMSTRDREVLTRAALGAGPLRLARQFLAESLLLSLAGGLLGITIARWGTDLLMTLAAARIPRAHEVTLDWQAFLFLLLACVATAVLFGLAPALTAARMDVRGIARDLGSRTTMGRTRRIIRDSLVIVEVALAFLLGIGAALVVREIIRLQNVDPGIVTDNVLTLHLTPQLTANDYHAIEARVSQVPGVRAAGFTQLLPLQSWGWEAGFNIKGRPPDLVRRSAELRFVTPGYFRAAGAVLAGGRTFADGDTAAAPRVIMVNQALVRQYLPGEDAVGRELDRGTIVGVVRDVRQVGLDRPAAPEIYYAAAQNLTMVTDLGMTLVVSATGAPESLTSAIRSAVRDVNPNVAIFQVKTMKQVVADSLWQLNLYRWLIGLFAALALGLAGLGLYGVIAYSTAARTREFAIRVALGSGQRAVSRLVLVRGLSLTAIGLGFGVSCAFVAWKLTSSLDALSISSGPDFVSFGVTAGLVLAIALLACAVPAARAARVDPAVALRQA